MSEVHQKRLVAGLCPDLLGKLKHSPRSPSHWGLDWGKDRDGKENGEREGGSYNVLPLSILQFNHCLYCILVWQKSCQRCWTSTNMLF